MHVTLTDAEIKNGKVSREFETKKLNGDYFAHVNVSPAGFECSLALLEECTSESVAMPCNAVITSLEGEMAFKETMNHHLKFQITDLWNCDITATLDVEDTNNEAIASEDLTWKNLVEMEDAASTKTLTTGMSYYDFDYTLTLFNEDGSVHATKTAKAVNPFECTVTSSLTIDLGEKDGEGEIAHTYEVEQSPACSIQQVTAKMTDNGVVSDVALIVGENTWSSKTAEALIYANFPLEVESKLEVFINGESADDAEAKDDYFPACTFEATSASMEHEVVVNAEGEREIRFTPSWSANA